MGLDKEGAVLQVIVVGHGDPQSVLLGLRHRTVLHKAVRHQDGSALHGLRQCLGDKHAAECRFFLFGQAVQKCRLAVVYQFAFKNQAAAGVLGFHGIHAAVIAPVKIADAAALPPGKAWHCALVFQQGMALPAGAGKGVFTQGVVCAQILQIAAQKAPVVVDINGAVARRIDRKSRALYFVLFQLVLQKCHQSGIFNVGHRALGFIEYTNLKKTAQRFQPCGQIFGIRHGGRNDQCAFFAASQRAQQIDHHLIGGVTNIKIRLSHEL